MSSSGVLQPVEVTDLVADLRRLAARLHPDAITDADVGRVVADLGQAKRLVDGMVTTMARRSDVATVARATGSTQAQARQRHRTSTRLADRPALADAVRRGALSDVQADAVADAVTADPTAADTLLTAAAAQSPEDLRRTCRDTIAAADPDPEATRQRHHRRRECRTWTAADGMWTALVKGPADYGARFDAALRAAHDRRFKSAYADGRREDDAAYRFDALFDVLEARSPADRNRHGHRRSDADGGGADTPDHHPGQADDAGRASGAHAPDGGGGAGGGDGEPARPSGSGRGRQQKVIVNVSAAALRRGRAAGGETCTIAGVGMVPLSAVLPLIPDAELAIVIRDGVDVLNVTHLSRQATAHQRTGLEARGYECEVPHCRSSHLLEIDHVTPWATTHHTILDQLAWLCRVHHRHKTRDGYTLTGPPGRRRWRDPTGHTVSADPDPDESDVHSVGLDDVGLSTGSAAGQPSTRSAGHGLAARLTALVGQPAGSAGGHVIAAGHRIVPDGPHRSAAVRGPGRQRRLAAHGWHDPPVADP